MHMKSFITNLPEPMRFLLAGLVNTAFGYGLFALLLAILSRPVISLGADTSLAALVSANYYVIIQWIAWVLSVPFGALTFKYYAFQSPGPYIPQAIKAYGVYFPAQLLASVLLIGFVRFLHFTPLFGQLCTLVFSTAVSYVGHKYFTFRKTAGTPGEKEVDGETSQQVDPGSSSDTK